MIHDDSTLKESDSLERHQNWSPSYSDILVPVHRTVRAASQALWEGSLYYFWAGAEMEMLLRLGKDTRVHAEVWKQNFIYLNIIHKECI